MLDTRWTASARRIALVAVLGVSLGACSVMRGQQTVGTYVDDAKITAEIKSKMAADKEVAATAISVETLNGVTQLSGFAKTQAEKERAASIARQASGVKSVRNDIVVRP
ncbi:MAG TPA: BON domain-containing protein [Burkholderiaceae bacterium]|nr:BON domain-containing protein [Burkholderiaceae bacterium]